MSGHNAYDREQAQKLKEHVDEGALSTEMLVIRLREEAQGNPDSLMYQAADEIERRGRDLKRLRKKLRTIGA